MKKFFAALFGICLLFVIGSVGAIDQQTITSTQGFFQSVGGVVGMLISGKLAGFLI